MRRYQDLAGQVDTFDFYRQAILIADDYPDLDASRNDQFVWDELLIMYRQYHG